MAERGLRDVLHAAVRSTSRVATPSCAVSEAAASGYFSSRRKLRTRRHPPEPVRHAARPQSVRLPEGWLDAAHAALSAGHGTLLGWHPRVLPPLSEPERVDRRSSVRDGAGFRERPVLVLRAVADSQRRAGARRQHFDRTAKELVVELTQAQSGEPYRLPLEVGISMPAAAAPEWSGSR